MLINFLILKFEVFGAIAAVLGTFVFTIPFRLYVTGRIVGGIYFPCKFFLKISLLSFAFAACLSPMSQRLSFFELLATAAGYFIVYLFLIRGFKLIQHRDVAEIKNLGFEKLNWVLNHFVAQAR